MVANVKQIIIFICSTFTQLSHISIVYIKCCYIVRVPFSILLIFNYFVFTETRPFTDDQPSHSREMGPELRDPSQVAADKCNAAL